MPSFPRELLGRLLKPVALDHTLPLIASVFPREILGRMIAGCALTQMLYVAARLELADRLNGEPRGVSELAGETGCHEPSLYRLLRGLASLGVFAEDGEHRFRLTEMAKFLRRDHPESLRASILMIGGTQYQAWSELLYSLQTGCTGFEKLHGNRLFDYLGQNGDEADIFDQAMVSIHGRETSAVLDVYKFSKFRRIIDVGGGNGSQLRTILQAHPKALGVLFDLPHVVERARESIAAAGLAERCEIVSGSFFEVVPSDGDAYLLRHIIHDWEDDDAVKILQTVRRNMPAKAKLLLIESVIPPGNDQPFAKILDLTMLVVVGGKERTESEYRELLAKSGFSMNKIYPTSERVDVIEALPV